MNESIRHRGPDYGGAWFNHSSENHQLALGHRRLSIIDNHARSNQPFCSVSKRWILVFNGEIYNFDEIKKELNYSFQTSSDTEVIVASIEEKGVNWFLNRANGMFAIALYDDFEKELYLIKDRFGIKPLYYFSDENKLIFSSEIKGILASGLIEPSLNYAVIDEYLANRYVREPYSFFKTFFN